MPSTRKATSRAKSMRTNSQPTISHVEDATLQGTDEEEVLFRLQSILADKALEALPLLNQLMQLLRPNPQEVVESEKRARSLVIAGVAEAEGDLEPFERLAHTEAATCKVLSALGVEARPTEIYRMGDLTEGKTRLIKCVLPSTKFLYKALRNAPTLRSLSGFDRIYIMRSMTRKEREKEKELRRQAHELNTTQHNGKKVYAVYRSQIAKAADIPKHPIQKTFDIARFI
ncbi:hypothetical protein Y032_0242g3402 [Ancylostoma ceylanicum]|uniref:Uncharacterized protein n=1 Tax=Ancylostoma ceylanicum TaxID=53326 RepID=A0A016SDI2_9BILA|nr:hypothetical protein Y032_0242g3402 [Ancylostoma ceylanicum]